MWSRRKRHIQWVERDPKALAAHLSNRAWFCMAFQCANTSCNMQMQLYLEMPEGSSSADVLSKIRSGTIRGNMVCGHRLSIAEPWGIFRVHGPIPTYALIELDADQGALSPILELMTLSARNQLPGIVEDIQLGTVMAHVTVRVGNNLVESVITRRSAEEMKLKKGDTVKAVIKSTEVMLLKD